MCVLKEYVKCGNIVSYFYDPMPDDDNHVKLTETMVDNYENDSDETSYSVSECSESVFLSELSHDNSASMSDDSLEEELFGSSEVIMSESDEQPALWSDSESVEENDLKYLSESQPGQLTTKHKKKEKVNMRRKLFRCNTRVLKIACCDKFMVVLDARGFLYSFCEDEDNTFKLMKSFKMDKYFVVDIAILGKKLLLISNKTGILKEIDLITYEIEDIRTNVRYFDRGATLQKQLFLINKEIVLVLDEKYQRIAVYYFSDILDIKYQNEKYYFLNSTTIFIVHGGKISKIAKKEYFDLTSILIHDDCIYLGTSCGLKQDDAIKKYGSIKMMDTFNNGYFIIAEDIFRMFKNGVMHTWNINVGSAALFQNSLVLSVGKFLNVIRIIE